MMFFWISTTSLFTMRQFLWDFAKEDLFAKEARVATWTTIATLAGLFVLITGGVGLVNGARHVRLDQLRRDGENRCVRGGSRIEKGRIDPRFLAALRAALEKQLQEGAAGKTTTLQFSSYRHNDRDFQSAKGNLSEVPGRTVKPGDPILANRPCWSADPELRLKQRQPVVVDLQTEPRGIIVSREFYESLQLGESQPQKVNISIGADLLPLQVLGVTDKPLPESLHFLWSEDTEAWLKAVDRKLKQTETGYSIHIPPVWLSPDSIEPPQELVKSLDSRRVVITARKVFRDGRLVGHCWDLQSLTTSTEISLQEWRVEARHVSDLMKKRTGVALPGIEDAGEIAMQVKLLPDELPTDSKDEYVSVYANDVDRLEDIAQVMRREEFRLKPNSEFARQRAEIGNQALMMLNTLWGTIGFAILIGIGGVVAIEAMRAAGRKAEIGMLRAIGMSSYVLNGISCLETILLTLIAAVVAAVATILFGSVAARLIYSNTVDRQLGFQVCTAEFWQYYFLALLIAIIALPWATGFVNRSSRQGDPAELIRF